jgi:hypothetical protein
LILTLKDESGSIRIQNWYASNNLYKLDEIAFADGIVWKASTGMTLEDWFQEQEELAAAASLLTGESADPFGLTLFRASGKRSTTTADLNTADEFTDKQAVVDFALAALQMEEDTAMVGSMEESKNAFAGENKLAASASTLLQQKKPFGDNL